MAFGAAWMDIDIIILSKRDFERQILYHLYVESKKKKGTNEVIYKTEIELQIENKLVTKGRKGEGNFGRLGLTHICYYTKK